MHRMITYDILLHLWSAVAASAGWLLHFSTRLTKIFTGASSKAGFLLPTVQISKSALVTQASYGTRLFNSSNIHVLFQTEINHVSSCQPNLKQVTYQLSHLQNRQHLEAAVANVCQQHSRAGGSKYLLPRPPPLFCQLGLRHLSSCQEQEAGILLVDLCSIKIWSVTVFLSKLHERNEKKQNVSLFSTVHSPIFSLLMNWPHVPVHQKSVLALSPSECLIPFYASQSNFSPWRVYV